MVPKKSPLPFHISFAVLWTYSRDKSGLDDDCLQHLTECEDCVAVLGICRGSRTLEQAQRLLEEEGFRE